MGQVWAALDEALLRRVAVKIAGDEAADARIEREARIGANIQSPHLPAVFDFGVDQGSRYLVMEKLEGEDLGKRLAAVGRLTPFACVSVAHQAGRALDAVHAAGAVHRDVSPANLFYKRGPEGETLILIDFGIARGRVDFGPKLTLPGCALGCPDFIAPEQLMSAPDLDGRADLFSLATVLYRALVGELPFGDSLVPVSRHYSSASNARARLTAFMPRMNGFFMRALAMSPGARYASGAEMAAAFHARIAER